MAMMPGGFHHRELKRPEGIPVWVKAVTAIGGLVAVAGIAGVVFAPGAVLKIACGAVAGITAVAVGLVWLYFSTSDRVELPLHRHGTGRD